MATVPKTSIKLSNIALLDRARYENGICITIVNVGDPRNSIVTSLDGSTKLSLTKDEIRRYINISDAYPEVSDLTVDAIKEKLPNHEVNLYKTTDSTVHAILFDSMDINERESIICFSNTPESTKVLDSLAKEHNKSFEFDLSLFSDLTSELINALDDISIPSIDIVSDYEYLSDKKV